ncbi:hypothetical protein V9K67_21455 [Paraflavisolibacter sp. H34]|uniref:TraG/VirB4 family ATPase n=1 Tax=Huijunlia imazamoxiresistens TaxID=3127457 RepID=UPI003016A0B1
MPLPATDGVAADEPAPPAGPAPGKGKREKYRSVSIEDACPILLPNASYDGNVFVNKFGDWSLMYKVQLPEVFSLDFSDYEILVSTLSRSLNIFPADYVIHFLYFCTPRAVSVQSNRENLMDRWFTAHVGIRSAMQVDCYVVFTRVADPARTASDFHGVLSLLNFQPAFDPDHYSARAVREMYGESEKFMAALSGALTEDFKRLGFAPLTAEEAFRVIADRYLNGRWQGESRERSDLFHHEDGMTVGDQQLFCAVMNHNGYPTELHTSRIDEKNSLARIGEVEVSFAHQLVYGLDFPHLVHNIFYTLDQKKVREGLEARERQMRSLAAGNSWNVAKLKGIEEGLRLISEHPEYRLVEQVFAVQLLADSGAEGERSRRIGRLRNLFATLDIGMNMCAYATMNYFFTLTPGVASAIPKGSRALGLSQWAASMMCFEDLQRSAITGVPFMERRFNTPVWVDIWNYPGIENRNQVVIGSSGAGKSFLLGHLVSYFLYQFIDVIIVDIGFSYKKLLLLEEDEENRLARYGLQEFMERKNAYLVESSASKPLVYNPFLVAIRGEDGDWRIPREDHEIDPANFIVTLIFMAWKGGDEDLSSEVYSVLTQSVDFYYDWFNRQAREEREGRGSNEKYGYPSFTGYYNFLISEFKEHFPRVTSKHFDLESFELVLGIYAHGHLRHILNCEKNPDIFDARFVVFELEYIKNDKFLFGITSVIIMQVVLEKMIYSKKAAARKGRKVYLLMDEVWKVLSSSMKPFVQYMYKTARKHDGAICVATQEAEDIIKSGIGDAINGNSDIKILTVQKQDKRAVLQDYFSLSDAQTNLLYSLQKDKSGFRDVFFKFGTKATAFRFEVSPEQALVLSSSARDKGDVYGHYDKNGNMERSVYQVLEDRGQKGFVDEDLR